MRPSFGFWLDTWRYKLDERRVDIPGWTTKPPNLPLDRIPSKQCSNWVLLESALPIGANSTVLGTNQLRRILRLDPSKCLSLSRSVWRPEKEKNSHETGVRWQHKNDNTVTTNIGLTIITLFRSKLCLNFCRLSLLESSLVIFKKYSSGFSSTSFSSEDFLLPKDNFFHIKLMVDRVCI